MLCCQPVDRPPAYRLEVNSDKRFVLVLYGEDIRVFRLKLWSELRALARRIKMLRGTLRRDSIAWPAHQSW